MKKGGRRNRKESTARGGREGLANLPHTLSTKHADRHRDSYVAQKLSQWYFGLLGTWIKTIYFIWTKVYSI